MLVRRVKVRISGLWKRIHLPNSIDVGGNEEAGGGEEDVGKLAAPGVGRDYGLLVDIEQFCQRRENRHGEQGQGGSTRDEEVKQRLFPEDGDGGDFLRHGAGRAFQPVHDGVGNHALVHDDGDGAGDTTEQGGNHHVAHAGVDVVADFLRFFARNRSGGDTDQQEQTADGFKAEVFDEDHRDSDGEHDEAGDTGVFLPLAEGHFAFGGIFGGDSLAHGAVGFERQAFLRVRLDLRGIAHHVDDGDDEHGEQHQGTHSGAGKHRQLGNLLADAN